MPTIFLIMGLPRSRTLWLSHLFTTPETQCFHDLAGWSPSVWDMAGTLLSPLGKRVVGSSCSAQVLLLDKLVPLLPRNTRFLYVRRSLDEAARSFQRVTGLPGDQVEAVLRQADAALDQAEKDYPGLSLPYEYLNDEEHVRRAWGHVAPNVPFPAGHYHQIKDTNIQLGPAQLREAIGTGRRCAVHEAL